MKKIALITASILALGAAAIAADSDGLSTISEEVSSGTHAVVASAAAETGGQDARLDVIEREVRMVRSPVAQVRSCDAAYWPYYPADCLTTPEPSGL